MVNRWSREQVIVDKTFVVLRISCFALLLKTKWENQRNKGKGKKGKQIPSSTKDPKVQKEVRKGWINMEKKLEIHLKAIYFFL